MDYFSERAVSSALSSDSFSIERQTVEIEYLELAGTSTRSVSCVSCSLARQLASEVSSMFSILFSHIFSGGEALVHEVVLYCK